jgi:hypothetical protein
MADVRGAAWKFGSCTAGMVVDLCRAQLPEALAQHTGGKQLIVRHFSRTNEGLCDRRYKCNLESRKVGSYALGLRVTTASGKVGKVVSVSGVYMTIYKLKNDTRFYGRNFCHFLRYRVV